MAMMVHRLELGPLQANCYIVGCDKTLKGLVIDPADDAPAIVGVVRQAGLEITHILNTHSHPDHVSANCALRQTLASGTDAAPQLLIHEADRAAVENPPLQWLLIGLKPKPCRVDGTLTDGQQIRVGDLQVRVLHLPGHSPGSVAFVIGQAVFTGDTLFAGGVGRTDLPGGNHAKLMASLRRLVSALPPETVVYPGHGPPSTLAEELASNEWLRT